MTYRRLLQEGEERLRQAEIPEAKLDAWYLFQEAASLTREAYFLHMEDEAPAEAAERYERMLDLRCERMPLQYIIGKQDFMGLTFLVNPSVLIPRQDTETLVEQAWERTRPGYRILDLCTGSGCILLSLLDLARKAERGLQGTGADISADALGVAAKNADSLGLEAVWIESDLFEKIDGVFDMIVSNPPYIPTDEIGGLMPEVGRFEPKGALDGKEDGLFFYRRITAEAPAHLREGGYLFFEIGCDQGADVSAMMREAGFSEVSVTKDLCGLDRVVSGRLDRYK